MKSRPFVTKLSLANFCCLIVGLAFVKLSFAIYVMQGGELPSLTQKPAELSPKAAFLAKAHQEQKNQAKLEQSIVMPKEEIAQGQIQAEQNIVSAKTDKTLEQNVSGEMQNRTLHAGTKISFLPRSKGTSVAEVKEPTVEEFSVKNPTDNLEQSNKQEELSEINSDLFIAKASAVAISHSNAKVRENALYNDYDNVQVESLPENEVIAAEHGNYKNPKAKKSNALSSLFGVGVAHANENYSRPDQQTNVVVPTPQIKPYASPDSLRYKEQELARKEEELLMLQQQMNSRMDELNQLEGRIGDMVDSANVLQDDKYQHLVNTYTNMKARSAAQALSTLDEKIAVQILNGMKSKQAGEIFSYMQPMHAARLSEALAKFNM